MHEEWLVKTRWFCIWDLVLRMLRLENVGVWQLSRNQNPFVGSPLVSGSKELAVSKHVGFVSYCEQTRSACCAVSCCKLLLGILMLPL